MEGAKFYDDSFFNNEVYAKIGGVPVEELNHLELEFVFLIGFSLVIAPEEYPADSQRPISSLQNDLPFLS